MHKTIKHLATLAGILATMTVAVNTIQTKASASSYQIIKTKYYSHAPKFHAKNKTQNAYLWNKTHTKKLHNIKNYPNSIWTLTKSEIVRHNGKDAVYYYVTAASPNKRYHTPVNGRIWRGYLTKGYNQNYAVWNNLFVIPGNHDFVSDTDYANYIQKSPSQALTRKVLAMFPNSKVSIDLSENLIDSKYYSNAFTDTISLPSVNTYFDPTKYTNLSTNQRAAAIEQALNDAGYTQAKRDAMSNYKIGIYYCTRLVDVDEVEFGLQLAIPAN